MIYRELSNSNIKISAVVFGAWAIGGWMWGKTDINDSVAAIQKSFELGVTSIDTAAAYGFGLSEEIIAKAVKGKRDKFQIFTKCGLRWDLKKGTYFFDTVNNDRKNVEMYKYSGKESIIEECENSLKRLKTDYIDLYQIHWPDETTPFEETMEVFDKLIKEGKIRSAGVSNFNIEQVQQCEKIIKLSSNQIPYSMINRKNDNDIIPYCSKNKTSILVYSPMQRGLLTGKITADYKFSDGDNRASTIFFKKENIEKTNNFLNKIKFIAEERNITLSQLVINWTLQKDGITGVLVGARNTKQAEENAKSCDFMLSKEDIDIINKHLLEVKLDI